IPRALRTESVPRYAIGNLIYSLPNISDPRAVPILSSLLRSGDVLVRRAAAEALRNTASQGAVRPLVAALADPDRQVQYSAVIGLADITRQPEWRPLDEEFRASPQRYIQHWRDWGRAQEMQ